MQAFAFVKAKNLKITPAILAERAQWSIDNGYQKQKRITFCEEMIARGFTLYLYEAKETWSKYITVSKGKISFKVRFSNHRPNKQKERAGDCDFFVGVNNGSIATTEQAIEATFKHFGVTP